MKLAAREAGRRESVPALLRRSLERTPLLLSAALAAVNRVRRLRRGRAALAAGAIALLAVLLLLSALSGERAAAATRFLLDHSALVIAAWALYTAGLVARKRRDAAAALRRSWLVATPEASRGSGFTTLVLVSGAVLFRLFVAGALALALCAGESATIADALRVALWLTVGAAIGAAAGAALARGSAARAAEAPSRYVPRPRLGGGLNPSAAALSRWPIAQAFAWSRPENARWLLLTAILSVPVGAGALGGLTILATWLACSYLAAVLAAIPAVARTAADWLRSTPIAFWELARPIAGRTLAHQAAGTLVAAGVLALLGATPLDAVYFASVWLAIVVLVTAVSLADCYRARSPAAKIALTLLTTLLAEGRLKGAGVAIALAVAAFHLRLGATHERA